MLKTTAQGYTISLTSASRTGTTVTIVTTRAHGFSTGYEVVVAGITGAAGTTMNGTFIVTVTNTTTFTYTAAGTAGSGTVTSATVKAGPGTGIIYLQPAATAAGRVQVDGDLVIDGANSLYAARIRTTAAQSLTNNTELKLTFNLASSTPDNASYDPQGWFNDANDSIDIGIDGFYCITANVALAANATGRRALTVAVNGATVNSVVSSASSSSGTNLVVTTNIYLFSGDQVTAFAFQNSGGALNTVSGFTALSVGRIGA